MAPPSYASSDRGFDSPPSRASPYDRGLLSSDADMSAPSIDDGSFAPSDDPNAPRADRSSAPRSPQPRLVLFDARSGKQETIELGSASSVMTLDDYKRINRKTTERGMVTGLLGGGVLTYLVKRFMPKTRTPSRNALALTFIFSSSFISFSTSRAMLVSEILAARAKARQRAIDNGDIDPADTPGSMAGAGSSPFDLPSSSSGAFGSTSTSTSTPNRPFNDGTFSDPAAVGDSPASLPSPERYSQGQGAQQVYGASSRAPAQRTSLPRGSGAGNDDMAPRPAGMPGVGNVGLGGRPRWVPPSSAGGAGGGGGAGVGGGGLSGVGAGEGELVDPYASSGQPRFG